MLAVDGLTAGYGAAPVLSNVSFTVPAGDVLTVLGANGAGKTTLLRTLAGVVRPEAGTVEVGGHDVTSVAPHRRATLGVCHIPERRALFRSLTVRENVELFAARRDRTAFDRACARFAFLASRAGQVAGTLSGGEQQLLALTRVFVRPPRVLLVDEVSLGLSPRAADEVYEVLGAAAREGTAIVLVEQYMTRALALATEVLVLQRGSTVFQGRPGDLDRAAVVAGYLGDQIGPGPAVRPNVTRPTRSR